VIRSLSVASAKYVPVWSVLFFINAPFELVPWLSKSLDHGCCWKRAQRHIRVVLSHRKPCCCGVLPRCRTSVSWRVSTGLPKGVLTSINLNDPNQFLAVFWVYIGSVFWSLFKPSVNPLGPYNPGYKMKAWQAPKAEVVKNW